MLWPVIFFAGITIALILWRPKERRGGWEEMTSEEKYMLAKKIFTRDPSSFKDQDSDGVDDILEK